MAVKEQKRKRIKMIKKTKVDPKAYNEDNRDLESGDNPEERLKGMKSSSSE